MKRFRRTALIVLMGAAVGGPAAAQELGARQEAPVPPRAARDLPRGAVLTAEDLEIGGGPTPSGTPAPPIGWVTRRVVREGEPLREPAIGAPELVASGDIVQLVWSGGGMELRLRGRAIGSAGLGERIQVRLDVRRRFEGVVEGPGLVRLESR